MKQLKRRQFLETIAGTNKIGLINTTKSNVNTLSTAQQSTAFQIQDSNNFSIFISTEADPVVRCAAKELKKYLHKISSFDLLIVLIPEITNKNQIVIAGTNENKQYLSTLNTNAKNLPDDGFSLRSANNYAVMEGSNPRGALYAVYTFLEALGCRFYGLDETGEVIPEMNPIPVPELTIEEKPSYRWREWKEDMSYVGRTTNPEIKKRHEEFYLKLSDWMGKNRINLSQNRNYPKGQTVMDERGIRHCTGGHIIPQLLPRELFDKNPDYFRMDQTGKRVKNGNLCPSNPATLKIIAENAVKYTKENSWAVNIEVVGEDIWDGSWCYCPECKTMTVQDQYITACNAIAHAIRESGSSIQIDAMAYHDTLEPDLTVKPDPDLRLMWAPRERSFGHPLNDPRSDLNQWYASCFEQWANIFGPKNIDLFEYWTDNILFRTFPISCPHLVAQDIQYYNDIGVDNHCVVCHLGDYAFQSEPLNCYVYARMLYNRNLDVDEIIADYCHNMYGTAAATMTEWHNQFEEAMHYCATFGDVQRVPTDFSPRVEKLMIEIQTSRMLLQKTNVLVKRALRETQVSQKLERITTQSWINDFAIIMVNGLHHQIRGEYYFAAVNEIIWERTARNRDPYAGLSGRYIQVKEEMQQAVKYYEDAVAFMQALPPKEHSVWGDTSLPNHNKGVCDVLKAKIAECEKHTV